MTCSGRMDRERVRKAPMFDPQSNDGKGRRGSPLDFARERQTKPVPVDRQALIDRIGAAAREMRADEARVMADGDDMAGRTRRAGTELTAGGSAGGGYGTGTGGGASAGPDTRIRAVWRPGLLIVILTMLGAALGVMLALSMPHRYEAVSQLMLDPRGLRLTDAGLSPQSYSAETMRALADSQVKIVGSGPVLQAVVQDLDLADDPEFNGTGPSGIAGALGLFPGLFFAGQSGDPANREVFAVQSLTRNLSVSRGQNTFIVSVSATTGSPGKSALIANRIADVYIAGQRDARMALFERDTAALTRQLDALLADVEDAERRVEQYKVDNDLFDPGAALIGDERIARLGRRLAQLRARKAEIQGKPESGGPPDMDSVLSRAAPEILQSSPIGALRAAYSGAKRTADALATSLGPRHPRRIAADEALNILRSQIDNELRRIARATRAELERIVRSERQLAAELATLKSEQAATSADLARLRELEREADAASATYQSFLDRAGETRDMQERGTGELRVISEATPPLRPIGPPRLFVAAGGLVLGFAAGLAITMMIGAVRNLAPRHHKSAETLVEGPAQARPAEVMPPAPDHQPREKPKERVARSRWPQMQILRPEYADDENDTESGRRRTMEVQEAVERLKKVREEARVPDTKRPAHAGSTENGVG